MEDPLVMSGTEIAAAAPSAELITGDPRLFNLLYEFNYAPAAYLHPSQRERFLPAVPSPELWEAPRARSALSDLVLGQLKFGDKTNFDASLRHWPLLLLDHERLLRVARHVGAALVGPEARKAMARDEVLRWKSTLGPELYRFAMTAGALLPVPALEPASLARHTPEDLGWGWLDAALSDVPEELLVRARLKYPVTSKPPRVRSKRAGPLAWAVLSTLEKKWCSSFAPKAA
ncbi:MAG: hypothetical protein JWP36_2312 [Paucimonas sp.]|nr:hypothetical protein [Paucimonas sp.]